MLDTLAFVNEASSTIGVAAGHASDIVLAKMNSNNLVTNLRDFLGPIILLVMGIISITFLVRREMTQFIVFLVIAVVVAAIFYVPDIIKNLGKSVGNSTKSGWG